MLKLNSEATAKHQRMLQLEEQQDLLLSQLDYIRGKNLHSEEETKQRQQKFKKMSEQKKIIEERVVRERERERALKSKLEANMKHESTISERISNLEHTRLKLKQEMQSLVEKRAFNDSQLLDLQKNMNDKDRQYEKAEQKTMEYRSQIQSRKAAIAQIQKEVEHFEREIAKMGESIKFVS